MGATLQQEEGTELSSSSSPRFHKYDDVKEGSKAVFWQDDRINMTGKFCLSFSELPYFPFHFDPAFAEIQEEP